MTDRHCVDFNIDRLMDQWTVLDFEKSLALNFQEIISVELIISYTYSKIHTSFGTQSTNTLLFYK